MGQKVNPIGLRIGINKDWQSTWYANKQDFATFIKEDHDIRAYFNKKQKWKLKEQKTNLLSISTQANLA